MKTNEEAGVTMERLHVADVEVEREPKWRKSKKAEEQGMEGGRKCKEMKGGKRKRDRREGRIGGTQRGT